LDIKRRQHARDVRKQIEQRENEQKMERKEHFSEGNRLRQEAIDRQNKLNEIKQRKLAELRDVGIPEKYCAEISRKITAGPSHAITQ
jgi:hypothetical protein